MNPSQNAYVNDHTRLLDKLAQQADAHAAKAAKWFDELAAAKAEAETAETAFLSDFSPSNARDFAEAKKLVRNLTSLTEAINNAGGAQYSRLVQLRTPLVFSTFAKGFAERRDTLMKLLPPARKQLAARQSVLIESGVHHIAAEADPIFMLIEGYLRALGDAADAAAVNQTYSETRGKDREPRSFDNLYAELVAPLPQAPAISAPTV